MTADRTTSASPWRVPGCETSLLCWRDDQLAALANQLGSVLSAWRAEWAVPGESRVGCAAAKPVQPGGDQWRGLQSRADGAGWLHVPRDGPTRLATAIFSMRTPGPVAQQVAAACEQDALARITATLDLAVRHDGNGPGAAECSPWSGAVEASFPQPLGWRLVLQASVVLAWCRSHGLPAPSQASSCVHAPLASAAEALAARPLTLEVLLEGCELDLGSLQRLQPGDVVRLRHGIETPAAIADAAGVALFTGYLGRRGACKAVELAGRAPATARMESRQEALQ